MSYWNATAQDAASARRAAWGGEDYEASAVASADVIERLLPFHSPVVELGCGTGRVAEELARRWPSHKFVGVDSSTEMLRFAHYSEVTYMLGDGRTLPLDMAGSIYSHLVFQHLDQSVVEGYFREFARVLRPGGRWLVQFVQGTHRDGLDHRYSVDEMATLAASAGLRVASAESAIYPEWVWMAGELI